MSVPLVNASIYGNNIEGDNTNNATSARRKDGGDDEMLQPQYNADGWLPGVIMMMICRYSGCIFLWWIIIRIISRIVARRTADVVTSSINISNDPYNTYSSYRSSAATYGGGHACTTPFVSILIGFLLFVIDLY